MTTDTDEARPVTLDILHDARPMTYDRSDQMGNLAAALAKAQGAMRPAAKDATNPHFRSRYADLAAVVESVRAPLAANQIAILQPAHVEGARVSVTTLLVHASGEWIAATLELVAATSSPQAVGSALTYARRYALASLLAVAADEDDDGNAASAPGPTSEAELAPREGARAGTPISLAQRKRLWAIAKDAGWTESALGVWLPSQGYPDTKAIPMHAYDRVIELLRQGPPTTAPVDDEQAF